MAKNSQVNVGIKFKSDIKEVENSLNKLKKSLQDLQNIKPMNFKGTRDELEDLKKDLKEVEQALSIAFNPKLNTLNLNSFYQKLNESGISVNKLSQDMAKMGPSGNAAFNRLASQVLNTNLKLKQTHSLLDSMGKTMVNTVKWGIASSVMNTFTQSVQGAFQYVQSLEKSLTNIRIVTGDSTEKMAQFAEQANKSAQALGRSTLDYTKASLTYYQQGLNDEDVQARTEATLKAQNITGAGSQMADYLTSVWNGYKVANEEAELYVDKLAAVADSSASDMSQLAIAMSKVASTANTMGVDIDQLNAQIATVVATTRQAPESVGTAFKTIYTRMNDIKTGSEDAEISLGRYSGTMAELGFNVLDATGHLRDTGQVMEEIGGRWQTLTKEQQIYLAQTMGGQRQVNQLMALFDNWTTYSDLLNTSLESEGTLAEKNTRYMESLGAKMEQLGAAGERVKAALIDENEIKGVVDVLTQATNLLGIFIEGLGGGSNALLTLGSIATSVFSDSIAKEINNIIINFQNADDRLKKLQQQKANTQKWVSEISPQLSSEAQSKVVEDILKDKQEIESLYKVMSNQEINTYNALLKEKAEHNIIKTELEEKKKISDDILNGIQKQTKALKDQLRSQGQLSEEGKNFLKNFGNPDELQASLGELKSKVEETFQTISSMKIDPNAPIEESIAQLRKPLDQFLNSQGEMGKILENTTGYKQLQDQLAQTGITADTAKQAILGFLDSSANGIENLDTQKYRELTTEIDKQAAKYREAENARREYFQGIKQLSQVKIFVQMAAGVAQVTSGIRTLWNLQKTWKDDSISTGEKIIQTLTSGSMALVQLYTGFQKVGTGLSTLILKWKTMALTSAGVTAQQITQQKLLQVTYAETAKAAWSSLGPYLLAAAAVVAAVGLIVAVYKEWNREAEASKKANEIAADAKKTYDDLKTSLDNVKTALEDLHSAEDNLDGLTRGTQEWRDALQQCNEKVLELISNYPELAQYVTNQNGQLKLSAEGEQAYLDKMQEGVQNARNASYIASSNAREADVMAAAANIGHNSIYEDQITRVNTREKEKVSKMASADQVKSVVEAIDKVIGEGTELKGNLSGLSDEIAKQTGYSQQLVSSILANEDAVLQLKAQLEQNATTDKLMYEAMAANSLQDNNTYKGMDQYGKQVANAIAGADLNAKVQQIESDLMETMTKGINIWSGASNQQVKYILDQLNKAQGTNWKLDSNAVRGTDDNRAFAFLDQMGQLHTYTAQQIASTIAAKEALQNLGTSAETAAQMLKHIDTSGISGSAQEAVKQWISGQDMSATTRAGLEELKGQNIQNLLGEQGAQALAKQWDLLKEDGTADIEALNERWHSSCDDMSNAFYTVAQDASISVQQAFNSIKNNEGLKNATLDFQRMVVGDMQKALAKDPTGGLLKNVTDFYGKIQDFEKFDDVIENFDFSKGPEELKKQLEQIGAIDKDVDLSNIQAFVNLMKQVSQLSPEQNYKNVHDITDKLKRGDTIDADQAQVLKGAGVDVDAFFQHMADGSLKLKTNAETFQEYINNITMEPFKAKIDDLQNKIDGIHAFEDSKYSANNMGWEDFSASAGNITTVQQGSQMVQRVDQSSLDTDKLSAQLDFLKAIGVEDQNIGNLQQAIQDKRVITAEELKNLNELLIQQGDKYNNLSEVEKQHLQQIGILREQMANANDPGLDQDVDEEKWENLSEHLQEYADQIPEVSDELKDNADAADDLAQAILRYDSAIGKVKDNYDDWLKALSSDSIEDQIEATEDLENVYSDLLDLPFDNILSQDFLSNVDNLNLLKQAANGSEQAYNQLMQAAQQDIQGKVSLDNTQFWSAKDEVTNAMDQMNFQDIQIGANLDTGNFINQLENMVNAAGMTAEQATDYLASMGIDAQVEEINSEATETKEQTGFVANATKTSLPYDIVYADGLSVSHETGEGVIHGVDYTPVENPVVDTKENKAFTLKVKSARKSSGGGFKYKNSSAGNKGGGGNGKGNKGKGGGGKGSQPKQPKQIKPETKKADRYHDNTVKANKLANQLTKLNKQHERLTGKDALDNLKKQLDVLEKQNDNIRERIGLEKNELTELKNQLTPYGAKFNPDGSLANYKDTFGKIMDQYNKAMNKWNTASAEWQQENKDFADNAKKKMEEAIKVLEEYDKVVDKIAKSRQEMIDKAQDEINKKVQIFKVELQAELDLTNVRRDLNNFRKEFIEKIRDDDILGQNRFNFKDLSTYFNSAGSGSIQYLTDRLNEIMPQENFFSTVYNDGKNVLVDDAARIEQIKNLMDKLSSEMGDFKEIVDAIKQSIFDAIDAAQEAFDEQMDEYEYLGDLLDHNQKITEMLFGDRAYDQMDKYYKAVEENNNKQLDFLSKQKDLWYGRMTEQQQRMDSAKNKDSDEYKQAEKRFKEYEKHWMDSVKNLNAAVEDSLENILNKYANAIDKALLNLELKFGNGNTFDDIEDEWDRINDQADMYLDKINSAYEIDKLANAYQDAIKDNDGDIAAQQALNDLMEQQLAYLKDKDKLTQYDVDRANTLLQIEMKRLALEQSRSNKNRLRLRRDSQGNYTYQYTADTQSINKAEQELADAKVSLYNADKAAYVDNLNSIQKSAENFKSRLEDIWKDKNLSYEQQLKKSYELQKYYGDMINDLLTDNASIRNNLIDSTFEDIEKRFNITKEQFSQLSKEEQDKYLSMYIPQINSATSQLVDKFIGEGGIGGMFQDFIDEARQVERDKVNSISMLEQSQRQGLIKDYDTLTKQAEALLEDNDKLTQAQAKNLIEVQNNINAVNQLTKAYEGFYQMATKAYTEGAALLEKQDREILGLTRTDENQARANNDALYNKWAKKTNSGGDIPNYTPYQSEWSGTSYAALFGSTSIDQADYLFNKDKINNQVAMKLEEIQNNENLSQEEKLKQIYEAQKDYATAIKELDNSLTNNMINSLNKDIFTSINNTLNDILKSNQEYYTKSLVNQESMIKSIVTNQDIHIDADFPNAKDVYNIIRAMEDLAAAAAQKAGSTTKLSTASGKVNAGKAVTVRKQKS